MMAAPAVTTLIAGRAMTSGIHRLFSKKQLFRSKTIYPDSRHIGREAQ